MTEHVQEKLKADGLSGKKINDHEQARTSWDEVLLESKLLTTALG
jgi:hypothetical protein